MLARHPVINTDPIFKLFLTCVDSNEFEKIKTDENESTKESSIAVTSIKQLKFQDTFNYLYSSIKNKIFDKTEPQEIQIAIKLDEVSDKITKYLQIIDKLVQMIEQNVIFNKNAINYQEELAGSFQGLQEEDSELQKTINIISQYHKKFTYHLKVISLHFEDIELSILLQ